MMPLADWRYRHLAYSPDVDDAACDAASACAMKVLRAPAGQFAVCQFKTLAGVVSAFADSVEVAPGATVPRSAVVVFRFDEHQRITELLKEMA